MKVKQLNKLESEVVKLNCEVCYRQFIDRVVLNAKPEDYPAFCHFCRGKYTQCDVCLKWKKHSDIGDFYDFNSCRNCLENYH